MNDKNRISAGCLLMSALIGVALASNTALAVEYYVSDCQSGADANCVSGSDANAGTSPNAPWKSVEKAQAFFQNAAAGTRVRFARGASYLVTDPAGPGGDGWTDRVCQGASNPCIVNPVVIEDYTPPWASGDEKLPILSNPAGSLILFKGIADFTPSAGYVIRNLDLRGGRAIGSYGIRLLADVDDILIENVTIDGFDRGIAFSKGNGMADRITVRGATVKNNLGQGFLGGGNDLLFENSYFEGNGSLASLDHNFYFSHSSNVTVRNSKFYRSTMVGGKCKGVSMVAHGRLSNILIEGNTIWEDVGAAGGGCWGIGIAAGYGVSEGDELFTNVVIRGNKIINVGNISLGVGSCVDCIIENNLILQQQSFWGGDNTGVGAPYYGVGMELPLNGNAGANDALLNNLTVRNNVLYMEQGSAGIRVSSEGTSHVVVGNVIYYLGSGSAWNCFSLPMSPASYEAINNNLCYAPNAPGSEWEDGSGSLASWRAASSFDMNSVAADPLFVAPGFSADAQFSTKTGSPTIDSGHLTLSAAKDILGRARVNQPDMGAYEFGVATAKRPSAPAQVTVQ